jgi:hypothetical protein
LDCNIDLTGPSEGKSSAKRLRDNSVRDVNLTSKGTRSNLKRIKQTKSNAKGVLAKSKETAESKSKCNVYDGPYATKDCYYTLKNPPS